MMPAAEQASAARASVEAAKKEEEQRSQAAAQAHPRFDHEILDEQRQAVVSQNV